MTSPDGTGAPEIQSRPSPGRARVWWGDELVAESAAAVRLEEPGTAPALYLPIGDIRLDRFRLDPGTVTCPVKGEAEQWRLDADDGATVLWRFTAPADGFDWLGGYGTFDHDRVRVELVDDTADADPADVATIRFPNWGDAADLIAIMDVRRIDERVERRWFRPRCGPVTTRRDLQHGAKLALVSLRVAPDRDEATRDDGCKKVSDRLFRQEGSCDDDGHDRHPRVRHERVGHGDAPPTTRTKDEGEVRFHG